METCRTLTLLPVPGLGEVSTGTDLAGLLRSRASLLHGDILAVTSKVVSKAEGRVVRGDRTGALSAETDRVVARRGGTSIVRTRHGLVLAAAGIDASNTVSGTVVLLPVDPDASARALRERLAADGGPNVAVVVTDTAGRAWRTGQTDIAIGAAGLEVLHEYGGRTDDYGNLLSVTAPAVADELAGAADLVKGKLGRCPVAVVRGLSGLVLPPGEHGPGAAALVRPEQADLFGHGAREAVLHSLSGSADGRRGFGAAADAEDLVATLRDVLPGAAVHHSGADAVTVCLLGEDPAEGPARQRELGRREARLAAAAFALGWLAETEDRSGTDVRLSRRPPGP